MDGRTQLNGEDEGDDAHPLRVSDEVQPLPDETNDCQHHRHKEQPEEVVRPMIVGLGEDRDLIKHNYDVTTESPLGTT